MCLICVGPLPEKKILENADIDNPHGIGVAWIEKRAVQYRKGISVSDLLSLPEKVKANCAVHFRLATAGGVKPELTHPFPVEREPAIDREGSAYRILMHNGHLSGWEAVAKRMKRKLPAGPMSDSRLLAHLVWRYGMSILDTFAGQRVMVMSRKKITLVGDWIQDGARWYSNDSYKERRISSSRMPTEWWNDGDFVQDEVSGKYHWVRYSDGRYLGTRKAHREDEDMARRLRDGFMLLNSYDGEDTTSH